MGEKFLLIPHVKVLGLGHLVTCGEGIVFVGNCDRPVMLEDCNKKKEESFTSSSGCLKTQPPEICIPVAVVFLPLPLSPGSAGHLEVGMGMAGCVKRLVCSTF